MMSFCPPLHRRRSGPPSTRRALCAGLLAAGFGLIVAPAAQAAQALNLRIGIAGEPYPPFAVKGPDGQWSGFEIDLAKAICQRIDAKCTIVETAWDGIIPALNSKKIDAIFASMSITPEREKSIAFTRPYYYSAAVLVAPKATKLAGITPADLAGKTIGVQTSTPNATYLNKHYAAKSTIRIYNTQDDVNSDLAAGRIDAEVADDVSLPDFLKTAEGARFERKGRLPKDPMFGPGIGAGLRKSDVELKTKMDAAIKAIYESGEFKKLEAKYFDFDISAQ